VKITGSYQEVTVKSKVMHDLMCIYKRNICIDFMHAIPNRHPNVQNDEKNADPVLGESHRTSLGLMPHPIL
jgi:hypothetical protein